MISKDAIFKKKEKKRDTCIERKQNPIHPNIITEVFTPIKKERKKDQLFLVHTLICIKQLQ